MSLIPAVGYVRRSTDKQEASLAEQTAAVQKYAAEKGYNVLRWYTDDAISGDDTRNRRAFLKMIADAKEVRDFKAIICWDRARFGRFDSIEYGHFVYPLREAGVCLATVMDGVTDWSDVSGRIIASVTQEGKHQQLIDHSANVARGQLGAANNGGWIGSPPYAYRLEGPKKAKRLVVDDPGKVRVVQRIFREYTEEGRSLHDIARRLNAEGFVSPGGRVNGWRFDAVKVILENPAYTGDFAACRSTYGKYHRIKEGRVEKANGRTRNPESEWIVRRDHHEAIVDRETFAKAAAIIARGKTGRAPYTPETNPYRLSGLLRCGRCGTVLHGMAHTGRRYYECGNRKYNGTDACQGCTVREDALLSEIADHLEGWLGLNGEALGTAAHYGALMVDDLPEAFEQVRRLVMPPPMPRQDRERLEKQAEQLRAQLTKARGNLVLLDAENIPDAQARIKQLSEQLAGVEQELTKSKPPADRDVNAVTLDVMNALYGLASCCRALARPVEEGWEVRGSLEEAAPKALKRLATRIAGIAVHTEVKGRGNGVRHHFRRGEIAFSTVGPVTGSLNPHRPGKSRECYR